MLCIKCGEAIPDESNYCNWCGARQQEPRRKGRVRGNGEGSVYKLPNGTYRAVVVLGYEVGEDGQTRRIERTKSGFKRKKDALEYLPTLRGKPKKINRDIKLKELYDTWLPIHEAEVSRSTINCYKAAFKYYAPLWYLKIAEIGIDDLQECIDDCDKGKRTRQNMKALGTLLYKYAIPRGYIPENINFAQYIKVGSGDTGTREAFTDLEIEKIRQAIGQVDYADYIYCMIYTGFRPHEFLSLDVKNYDRCEKCFEGGGKTEAGTNRSVTISPKIQPIVDKLVDGKDKGIIFCGTDGNQIDDKKFREECFYPALSKIGISRRLTPYCCRHTFATLMKHVNGADRDKLELMGHTSDEMLRHYQHVAYADLRKITDNL